MKSFYITVAGIQYINTNTVLLCINLLHAVHSTVALLYCIPAGIPGYSIQYVQFKLLCNIIVKNFIKI
jgi:hypothetical protein